MEMCDKGKKSEAFWYKGQVDELKEWNGHGVLVNPTSYGVCKALGVIEADIETIIDGSGGTLIEIGDLIVHTPEFCARGLKEARA